MRHLKQPLEIDRVDGTGTLTEVLQRLGIDQQLVGYHLPRFSELKSGVNDLLKRGFGVNTIAETLGVSQDLISSHFHKFSELKNGVNSQLERGFGVNTIAERLDRRADS